jgi:arginine exporter protein ArgO
MSLSVFITGLLTGLSLIVAIGAQNAVVLRQGLIGQHVFAVSLACSLSDAALIALGVTSFRQIAVIAPWFLPAMRYGGAAFLIWYGARNLYSALRSSHALKAEDAHSSSLAQTLAMGLALTWLNPQVYRDTLMLLGATEGALSTVAQRLHQKRESRRLMAAARVIEVVAREWRAPGFEHARQVSGFDVRPHVILR